MIEVIYPKFPGRILICDRCGVLLRYEESDIYGDNIVYCPVCKYDNKIKYNKNVTENQVQ